MPSLFLLCLLPLFAAPRIAVAEELETVRVTRSRPRGFVAPADEAAEFSGQRFVVPREQPSTLPSLLALAPGAYAPGGSGEGAAPALQLRGFDPWQTAFLWDDIPLRDGYLPEGASPLLPLAAFASVDVFPEGAPARLAADGLGGAVRLRLPERCDRSWLQVRGGSFGLAEGSGAVCMGPGARLFVSGGQSREDFLFYDTAQTPLDPTDDEIQRRTHNGFRRAAGVFFSELDRRGEFRLETWHGYRMQETPGPVDQPRRADLEEQRHLVALRYRRAGTKDSLAITQAVVHASVDESRRTDVDANPGSLFLPRRLGRRQLASYLAVRLPLQKGWELGASVRSRWDTVVAEEPGSARQDRVEVPTALETSWQFADRWSLHGGAVAFPGAAWDDAGRPASFFTTSPRTALVYRPDDATELRWSLGRFVRLPTGSELFGSPGGLAPNRALVPESALRAEVSAARGWGGQGPWFRGASLSLAFALAEAERLVAYTPIAPSIVRAENVARARMRSVEAAGDARGPIGLRLRASATFLHTENRSDAVAYFGKELPLRPRWRAGTSLAFERDRWSVEYLLRWQSGTFRDLANRDAQAALLDHTVRARVVALPEVSFALEVANLLDTMRADRRLGAFSTSDAPGAPGFPGPGRRIYVTCTVDL